MRLNNTPVNTQKNPSVILTVKNSALCKNKELFYSQKEINSRMITEKEYEEALTKIVNMDSIYFQMSQNEKRIYNINIKIIKNYLSQTK